MITIFAKTTQTDQKNLPRIGIFHLERNFLGRTVFITDQFFHVEIVDTLIFPRIATKGKSFLHLSPHVFESLLEITCKNRWLRRFIINILARLVAEIDDLARFDNHHTLSVIDGNFRAIRNDVVFPARIGTAATGTNPLLPFHHQDVCRHTVTIEKLFPLVGQDATCRTHRCFN